MIQILLINSIYKNSFANSSGRIAQWDDATLYLYFALITITLIGGWLIEKHRRITDRNQHNVSFGLVLCGALLAGIQGLRGVEVGIDTVQYRESYIHALEKTTYSDSTIELGWQMLTKMLRLVVPSSELFVFIISSLTILFVFKAIWRYRTSINIFVALCFYVGLYYFQAMNLMRIYLAMSIMLFYFYFLLEKKYLKYCVVVILSSFLHYSSLVMLLIVAMLWLYQRSQIASFIAFIIALVSAYSLSQVFGDYISIARYAEYASINQSSRQIGIMLFFDYLPCFIIIYYAYKNRIRGQWFDILVATTLIAFLMRFVSYYITIAGRMSIHFGILYILIIPYFVNHIRVHHKRQYSLAIILLLTFAFIKIHLYFYEYLSVDGIMPYRFVWDE